MSVRVERNGPVTTVIMNRPEARNAVNGPTAAELFAAFDEFDKDDSASVAVLWGDNGTFCAGADLKAFGTPDVNPAHRTGPGPMGPTRMVLSKPVIAAVSGYAVAGGLELALWCDLRVVEDDAIMGVFCRRWGVPLIDGGTVRLPRLIGHSRAMDLILTGRGVDAAEALAMGLANRVVPKGQARAKAEALAAELAALPQQCMRADRTSQLHQWGVSEAEAMDFEFGSLSRVAAESLEGRTALLEGSRPPRGSSLRLDELRLTDEVADGVGGHVGPVALPDLSSQSIGGLAVCGVVQHGLYRRSNAFGPSMFPEKDPGADALECRADTLLVDHRVGRHDDLRYAERQRPHRRAVATVSHHQRRGSEDLVMVEPGVHRRVLRHPQAGGVDARSHRHRRLDGQRRDRVEDVLEHSALPGEGTRAQADQDPRHRCMHGGLRHPLPHDTGVAYRGTSAHRVEVGACRNNLEQPPVFWRKGIRAPQPKHPADRARSEVLNGAIEAVHENDRRDAGVDDLGNSRGQDHVDDDGVHIMAPRCLHHTLAKSSIRRHAGEGRHDGRQRPLNGGIEMLSVGERFERKAVRLRPVRGCRDDR